MVVHLDIKPDMNTFKNIEKMKESKPSLKMKLGWMEQYSLLNKQADIYKIASKKTEKKSKNMDFPFQQQLPQVSNFNFNNNSKRNSIGSPNKIIGSEISNVNEDLLNFESPEFNIFELEKKIGEENILPVVSTYVFSSLNLFSIINYQKFENFIYKISKGYNRRNPYHTDLHAADMVQTLLVYYLHGNLRNILQLDYLSVISLYISAAIHDYGHPGVTNNFLIGDKSDVAIRYNDLSVLENFHVSSGFNIILHEKDCNIFEDLPIDDYKVCRKQIIQNVLATDMTLHSKQFQFLKLRIQTFNIKNGENVDKIFENLDPVTLFNLKLEFLNILIHAADVSNPTKPLEIYKIWAKKVVDEFFLQGDREKLMGKPISFNCDRETVTLPRSQLGFIDGIVLPFFKALNEFFPGLYFTLENLKTNADYFHSEKEKENDMDKDNDKEKETDKKEKERNSRGDNKNDSKTYKSPKSPEKSPNKERLSGSIEVINSSNRSSKSKASPDSLENPSTLKIKVTKNSYQKKQ